MSIKVVQDGFFFFKLRGSYETRQIFPPKLSQKQRKKEKKSSVSEEIVASPPKTHFKGWATIPPLRESSVINSFQ